MCCLIRVFRICNAVAFLECPCIAEMPCNWKSLKAFQKLLLFTFIPEKAKTLDCLVYTVFAMQKTFERVEPVETCFLYYDLYIENTKNDLLQAVCFFLNPFRVPFGIKIVELGIVDLQIL